MAFTRMLPRKGTVIPEHHRPQGSSNAALHKLPAFREHTHDLIGVVLYLPRQQFVVVPFRLVESGGAGCVITMGNKKYPQGGYAIDVSHWELQRAERVVFTLQAIRDHDYWQMRCTAEGHAVRTVVEEPLVIEPDPLCVLCGVWLNRPGQEIGYSGSILGPQCDDVFLCEERQHKAAGPRDGGVYRAPVQQ